MKVIFEIIGGLVFAIVGIFFLTWGGLWLSEQIIKW